jgi:hypothetical protein
LKFSTSSIALVSAGVFLALIASQVVAGKLPSVMIAVYFGASIVVFITYAWDKSAARICEGFLGNRCYQQHRACLVYDPSRSKTFGIHHRFLLVKPWCFI